MSKLPNSYAFLETLLGDILGFPEPINNLISEFGACLPPELDITKLEPGVILVGEQGGEVKYEHSFGAVQCGATIVNKIRREKKVDEVCVITQHPYLFEEKKGVIPYQCDHLECDHKTFGEPCTDFLDICIKSLTFSDATSKLLYIEMSDRMRRFFCTTENIQELIDLNKTLYIVLVCSDVRSHYKMLPNINTKLFCTRDRGDIGYITGGMNFYSNMADQVIGGTHKFFCLYREFFDVYML